VSVAAPALEARALSVQRGRREVLSGIDLELRAGEALALVGPNAAGKSSLVRALAGLLQPSRGEVRLHGRLLRGWPRQALAKAVALVTSEEEEPSLLAVEDRVALGRYPHRGPFRPFTPEDRAAVARALAQTGITSLARRKLGTLSAGERQLATLARGLAQEPELLLLDEPLAGVDRERRDVILPYLLRIRRELHVPLVYVTHDRAELDAIADRVISLDRGAAISRPQDLKTSRP
jgi:iron complex transport system ATP-binding protein